MPITRSAEKALRQSKKRTKRNAGKKEEIKKRIKEIKKLLTENKKEEALKLMPHIYKIIDKAAKTNVIKKGAADRKKSRLMRLVVKF